jgi:tyrosine-protein phosphatase SIW14
MHTMSSQRTIEDDTDGFHEDLVDLEANLIPFHNQPAWLRGDSGTTPCNELLLRQVFVTPAFQIPVPRPITAPLTQPINFGVVAPGLYRSGYPQAQDYTFIKGLKLKTIVTLVAKEAPDGYHKFMEASGITHHIFDMAGTKKMEIPVEMMKSIYGIVANRENWPLLAHCNHGKHRTGCVVGVVRKANEWDVDRIINEYTEFAAPKIRDTDVAYLRNFRVSDVAVRKQPVVLGAFFSVLLFLIVAAGFWMWTGSKIVFGLPRKIKRAIS